MTNAIVDGWLHTGDIVRVDDAGCVHIVDRIKQLADFKIPQYIVVSGGPLPRNPGGKLLEAQLRKSVEWGAPL